MISKKMTLLKRITIVVLILLSIYLVGPTPDKLDFNTSYPAISSDLEFLSDSISKSEANVSNIKKDNQAKIIFFNDSIKNKTEWALVYIHGFSASEKEGDPIHREFAKRYGMNLYLARMSEHGLKSKEPLLKMTSSKLWETAKNALAVGEKLGDKVLLMSTSTGGTLSLMLASKFPKKVDALINFSPNVKINDPAAFLLNNPWGLQMSRLVKGGKYNVTGSEFDKTAKYWNNKYRLEAVVNLQELLESSMLEETFEKITCPSLTVAYYKDENNQDPTVLVSAEEWMNDKLSTEKDKKILVKLPNVGVHPLASGLLSKDLNSVRKAIDLFAEEILNIENK